jgi:pimeloyl-ACP methyl ester carboxylesterase
MAQFDEERLSVNGIETAVLSAGEGQPLVFFHGAGTITGFDALLPLAERFRLIVPYHPGFGASADDPSIGAIEDYLLHYLDLFDQLELEEVSLVGHSMGGYMAAWFAIYQTPRIRRLVLAAPVGLRVREHPTVDFFTVPDEEVAAVLAEDLSIFEGHVPMPPTPEFLAGRYRESTSFARVFWARSYDLRLPKWLHRLTMPTQLIWGAEDKLVPAAQADSWAELIAGAGVKIVPGVGHLLFDESREAVDAVAEFVDQEVKV